MTKAINAAGAALMLCGVLTGAALAQNAPTTGQAPEAATAAPNDCIAQNEGFKMRGKTAVFEVALENKCERRLRCRVDVHVTNARGVSQGHGTLVLPPAAKDQTTSKRWSLPVKMDSGSAHTARNCRVL